MSIPPDFKQFAIYYNTANTIESKSPAASAVMKISFLQACEDYSSENQISPQAQQFLQNYRRTVPPLPPNGVAETQKLANSFYQTLSNQFQNGEVRRGMVQQFLMCSALFEVLDGDDNEHNSKTCKVVAVKIKQMLEKGTAHNDDNRSNLSKSSVHTEFQETTSPPVFNPGSTSSAPPVFNPGKTSSDGPPVYTPPGRTTSSGGPPVYNPPGSSSGGPPVYTPPGQASSSGVPPAYNPKASSKKIPTVQVDPSYDASKAKKQIKDLGYPILDASKYAPLDDTLKQMIEMYINMAQTAAKNKKTKEALGYLQDALSTWKNG